MNLETLLTLITIILFLGGIYFLQILKSKYKKSFSFRVLSGLGLGIVFGVLLQISLGTNHSSVVDSASLFMSLVGGGYVKLLSMMVIPLIFFAMSTSIINANINVNLTKVLGKILGVLMGTVMIAALIGIVTILIFNIDGNAIVSAVGGTDSVLSRSDSLVASAQKLASKNYVEYILSFVPKNIFYMLTAQESTATLSTVLFGLFLGYTVLQAKKVSPEKVQPFISVINSTKEVVILMLREILKLTPFGVFAMITAFAAKTGIHSAFQLTKFLIASYVAIIIMYGIHLFIIWIFKLNPGKYAKKSFPVLLFGFSSRSSMSAVPLNISTQVDALGVDEETASMAASFGTSIGQNGCAGIYPAMLAIMAAKIMIAQGADIEINTMFIVKLVIVVAISSFGIAGVGGGATFSAIAVLTIMGLDITIVALLISIEAVIDMARTALNISDAMVAGVVTAKSNGTLNVEKYNE